MRGVASGARGIKNRYGSTLEILSHVQLWYIEKETRDLVRIQQCELLESFNKSQSNYELSTGLAVLSEVSEQVLSEHETAESMFRLLLLTVREIERTGEWPLPLSYFAFWAVRLGGWLPQFDRCATCGATFGSQAAFHAPWEPGLFCEKCRRGRMRPLHLEGRRLAERFAGEKLDKIEFLPAMQQPAAELRESSLNWIEHHTEKLLTTRRFLEST
jgi:DNA repair protein RecO (recombination protein O)